MNLMRHDSLVVLKEDKSFSNAHVTFYLNKFYRCIELSDGDRSQMLVYGHVFNKEQFEDLFEYAVDRVKRDWCNIGLVDLHTGKAITKKAFNELADVHEYGSGRTKVRIIYFRNSRDCIYGFYCYNNRKTDDLKEAYKLYTDTLNGISEWLDDKTIQFGNRGIPIVYGDLGVWKETEKREEKSIF